MGLYRGIKDWLDESKKKQREQAVRMCLISRYTAKEDK